MIRVLSLCCVLAVLWLELPSGGQAVCCYTHRYHKLSRKGHRCNDCTSPYKYCGVGACNIFGCNCTGGCRQGRCSKDPSWAVLARRDEAPEVEDADDVIRAADADGDGRMSLDEARALLGGALAHDRRSLAVHDVIRAADADGDGRMSLDEARTLLGGGLAHDRRSLAALDADNDHYLTAREIDP